MPPASQTEHKGTGNTALPYVSNSSIIATDKHFATGSTNILTGLRQWAEKRPGFSIPIAGTWSNLARWFVWQRWTGSTPNGGAFIHMFCDLVPSGGSTIALVYKMQIGTDLTPVLLWTSASGEPFDFVVSNNTCYFGNGTDMKKYDSATLSNWGIVAPVNGPLITLVSGSLAIYTSWYYVSTYWNSNTSHESSPSPLSLIVPPFTGHSVNIAVGASTDPQVTGIRVYRTPDGGSTDPALMQEISGSPFANATAVYNDATPDVSLSIRTAPEFLRNDPPTPSKGFVEYSGRIWSFINNTTYYSGFEEIANGVPEECWPSGLDGNYYPFDKEVFGQAPLSDGIAVFTAPRIWKIEGDSLDTFRRYILLEKRGTRSRTAIASLGGSVAWLDTSNTIWLSNVGEISIPIRPDVQPINPQKCWFALHISGIYHWLVVLDGGNGLIYVYDLDTSQWMPPWTVGPSSALGSFETSAGNFQLALAIQGKALNSLNSMNYADITNTYSSIAQTNMFRLTPDTNPAFQGVHAWSEIKTDAFPPNKVEVLTDDDPTTQPFIDITANGEPSPNVTQGSNLVTTRWTDYAKTAQLMATRYTWNAANQNFHLYQLDEAFYPFGG